MEQKRERLRRYEVQHGKKLAKENAQVKHKLVDLNVDVHEAKFIYDHTRKPNLLANRPYRRLKMLLHLVFVYTSK